MTPITENHQLVSSRSFLIHPSEGMPHHHSVSPMTANWKVNKNKTGLTSLSAQICSYLHSNHYTMYHKQR